MKKMTISGERLKRIFSNDKARKIIVVCGLAVMVLLMISSFFGSSESKPEQIREVDYEKLEQKLEERLRELIMEIDGVENVSVMVIIDRTERVLYEKNNRLDSGTGDYSEETEVVLAGNSKEPLKIGTVMPVVRSAAVVCEGAENPVVRERVANITSKALNIGISKVYVAY